MPDVASAVAGAAGDAAGKVAEPGKIDAIKKFITEFYQNNIKAHPVAAGSLIGGAAGAGIGALTSGEDENGETHRLRNAGIGAAGGAALGAAGGKWGGQAVDFAKKHNPFAAKEKEVAKAAAAREELLWNEVYLPAYVTKCASLGVSLDESTIGDAIESTYLLKKYAADSRNNVVKSASYTLKRSFGMIPAAPVAREDGSVKQAAAALAQHPAIQAAFLA